jgi:chloramphenicol 3-O phosphotransferase
MAPAKSGTIILLNGASSAGKSTLARGLQAALAEPFWHYSIDHLLAAQIVPQQRIDSGDFPWRSVRPQFFDGFHRSIAAFAAAGNHLIVEHIVETAAWRDQLLEVLAAHDVFFVGLHCPLPELERRAQARGASKLAEARTDYATVHTFGPYDFEVHSTAPNSENVRAVIAAWQGRQRPSAFDAMRQRRVQ